DGPPLAASNDPRNQYTEWVRELPQATKDQWLVQWLTDPHSTVRHEILAQFRNSREAALWPTIVRGRTIAELRAEAEEIQHAADREKAAKAAKKKAKRLTEMAADPDRTLRETEKLVAQRSGDAYRQIARLLAELREALAG